jgi:hypothetical protein
LVVAVARHLPDRDHGCRRHPAQRGGRLHPGQRNRNSLPLLGLSARILVPAVPENAGGGAAVTGVVLAAGHVSPAVANFIGWAIVIVVLAAGLLAVLRILGLIK